MTTHELKETLNKMDADNSANELDNIKNRQAAIMNSIRAEEASTSSLGSLQNLLKTRAKGLLNASEALRGDLVSFKKLNASGNSSGYVDSSASAIDVASQTLGQQSRALMTQADAINVQIERNKMSVKNYYAEYESLNAHKKKVSPGFFVPRRAVPREALATSALASDIRTTFSGK